LNLAGNLAKAEAHWVNRDTIAWRGADPSAAYRLYHSPAGGIQVETESGVQGGTFIPLIVVSGGPLQSVLERFPHLKGATAFRISPDSCAQIPELLKGQLVLVKFNDDRPVDATSLQIPGFAFHAPVWSAIVPDLVTDEELPSAATLGGLQLNVSGIIGPALGGVLLYFLGANWVFAVNALCFVVVILALLQWKGSEAESGSALENFLESFSTAIRYVRHAPAIQVVIARNILFAFFVSVIPALMPVVGLRELHLRPCGLGLLFTSMGAGSVFSAVFVLPRARERLSSNTLIVLGNLLIVLVYVLMALVRQRALFLVVAALAGAGWTLSASELWVAAQRAMPASHAPRYLRVSHRRQRICSIWLR
jgi:hypothetical protein